MTSKKHILFQEVQRFRDFHWMFWLLMVVVTIISLALVHYVWKAILHGSPGWQEAIGLCSFLLAECALIYLTFGAKLVTEVRHDGVYIRYYPFHRRFHGFEPQEITAVEARRYHPLREYGGWGIRIRWGKKAYSVFGNQGVQLTFRNGKIILIGSQLPERLSEAIKELQKEIQR